MAKKQLPHDGVEFTGYTLKMISSENASNASKLAGIPNSEIDSYAEAWRAFPSLREDMFVAVDDNSSRIREEDIEFIVFLNHDFNVFANRFNSALASMPYRLREELFVNYNSVNLGRKILEITTELMSRVEPFEPVIDSYVVRQLLERQWRSIAADVKILQAEGLQAARLYYPSGGAKGQGGWQGYLLPLDIVQDYLLPDKVVETETLLDMLDEARIEGCTPESEAKLVADVKRSQERMLDATLKVMHDLTDDQIVELLFRKHLVPLFDSIRELSMAYGQKLVKSLCDLQTRYEAC
jgi:hypothetical protein